MATISKKRGKRGTTFRVQVRRAGASPITATFDTRNEADNWGKSQEKQLAKMKVQGTDSGFGMTLADLVDEYIEAAAGNTRLKLYPSKAKQLEWWTQRMGHLRLPDISGRVIELQLQALATGGKTVGGRARLTAKKPRGPATINRYKAAISSVLTYAVKQELIPYNPAHRVDRRDEPKGRERILKKKERTALLRACDQSESRALPVIVRLALATGCRQGDLMKLRWRDVDLKAGALEFRNTKNDKTRITPVVDPNALEALRSWARVRPIDDSSLVFPMVFPRPSWDLAVDAAGLNKDPDQERFVFHNLRHCVGSTLTAAGVPAVTVAAILGHSTLEMVKRYSHTETDVQRAALAKMNERLHRG